MAKTVEVIFTDGETWTEVEVANFYDPEKHHTVRKNGSTEKIKYRAMKFPDGTVYDKVVGQWVKTDPEEDKVVFQTPPDKIDFKDRTVKEVVIHNLTYSPDIKGVLEEVYRVLQDGGIFRTTAPAAPSVPAFADPLTKTYVNGMFFESFVGTLFNRGAINANGDYIDIMLRK